LRASHPVFKTGVYQVLQRRGRQTDAGVRRAVIDMEDAVRTRNGAVGKNAVMGLPHPLPRLPRGKDEVRKLADNPRRVFQIEQHDAEFIDIIAGKPYTVEDQQPAMVRPDRGGARSPFVAHPGLDAGLDGLGLPPVDEVRGIGNPGDAGVGAHGAVHPRVKSADFLREEGAVAAPGLCDEGVAFKGLEIEGGAEADADGLIKILGAIRNVITAFEIGYARIIHMIFKGSMPLTGGQGDRLRFDGEVNAIVREGDMEPVVAASVLDAGHQEILVPETDGPGVINGIAEKGHVFRSDDGIVTMALEEFVLHGKSPLIRGS